MILGIVIVRAVVGVIALLAAPFLYREHFLVLVLLRPTKEVLLAGGFLVREGKVELIPLLLCAIPVLLLGVWLMFALGRGYAKELHGCDLPGPAGRVLPPQKVAALQKVLRRDGAKVVVLGRLAAFPSALVAAAAGSSKMKKGTFLRADALGALLSVVEVVGAGLLLGQAYRQAGPWLTVVGVGVLAAISILVGRKLRAA